jgi:hypothetical protein
MKPYNNTLLLKIKMIWLIIIPDVIKPLALAKHETENPGHC